MFKDLPEGKTHYEGDNCGIKEHNMPNQPSKISDWEKRFDKEFWYMRDLHEHHHPDCKCGARENLSNSIKSFIKDLLSTSTHRTEVLEEVEKSIKGMPYKEECSILKSRVLEKINQLKNKEK